MKSIIAILIIILIIIFGGAVYTNIFLNQAIIVTEETIDDVPIITTNPNIPVQYIGRMQFGDISIRLLILKHCSDEVANIDAQDTILAVNLAKSKGLRINDIGNYHIDTSGRTETTFYAIPLDGLKAFISEQMKIDAEVGDTLIIYTLGHGSKDGRIRRLGQRGSVMQMFAEAAEENQQQILWWQLSCKSTAFLPAISSLTESQQEFFSMAASSELAELSYFRTQGEQLQKVFLALANNSEQIDPNQDHVITVQELRNFLNKYVKEGRGDLVWAIRPDKIIFGHPNQANEIPIIESDGSEGDYSDRYIPSPINRR